MNNNVYLNNSNLVGNELNTIKEALLDIMKATCIKFVPHTDESDYVVFVEYKHPDQENGFAYTRTCEGLDTQD